MSEQLDQNLQDFLAIREPGVVYEEHARDDFAIELGVDLEHYKKFPRVDDRVADGVGAGLEQDRGGAGNVAGRREMVQDDPARRVDDRHPYAGPGREGVPLRRVDRQEELEELRAGDVEGGRRRLVGLRQFSDANPVARDPVPFDPPGPSGKRISWREIPQR